MTFVIKHFNTWAACLEQQLGGAYWKYIQKHALEADIMHFSEVHSCLDSSMSNYITPDSPGHRAGPLHIKQLQCITALLQKTHDVYFEPQMNGLHDLDATCQGVQYGNVTTVRKELNHDIMGGMVYRTFDELNEQSQGGKPAGKSAHSVLVHKNDTWYQSLHTHIHWDQNGKIDTQERIEQFAKLLNMANKHRNKKLCGKGEVVLVLGGDFNLPVASTTLEYVRQSMQFGDTGGKILNKIHNITNTRTGWYPKKKPCREADYVIVSDTAEVISFEIDQTAPSDHALLTTVLK